MCCFTDMSSVRLMINRVPRKRSYLDTWWLHNTWIMRKCAHIHAVLASCSLPRTITANYFFLQISLWFKYFQSINPNLVADPCNKSGLTDVHTVVGWHYLLHSKYLFFLFRLQLYEFCTMNVHFKEGYRMSLESYCFFTDSIWTPSQSTTIP